MKSKSPILDGAIERMAKVAHEPDEEVEINPKAANVAPLRGSLDGEPSLCLAAPPCSRAEWKDGLQKEVNGEISYYTQERRFVLRTTQDGIGWHPVWVFESMRPDCTAKATGAKGAS